MQSLLNRLSDKVMTDHAIADHHQIALFSVTAFGITVFAKAIKVSGVISTHGRGDFGCFWVIRCASIDWAAHNGILC